jgi:hypothetical protein
MTALYPSTQAVGLALAAATHPDTGPPPPPAVLDWLARLRLLEGVPFAYLVADERLLPLESIRFCFLDRNWVDAAVDGALAAGAGTARERAHLRARHAAVRAAVDAAERNIWAAKAHPERTWKPAAAEVVTGFLLRSRVVSGWPGLHLRALRGDPAVEMRPLRVERLAPAVLLVLFDGLPDQVIVEEPRQGLQLGFDQPSPDRREVPAQGPSASVTVPFRPGAPGVVDVTALAARLGLLPDGPGPDTPPPAAALALRLVQLPYRQVFSGPPEQPCFVPSITLADLDDAFGGTP